MPIPPPIQLNSFAELNNRINGANNRVMSPLHSAFHLVVPGRIRRARPNNREHSEVQANIRNQVRRSLQSQFDAVANGINESRQWQQESTTSTSTSTSTNH